MTEQTNNTEGRIRVPALVEDGETIIPEFWLSKDIQFRGFRNPMVWLSDSAEYDLIGTEGYENLRCRFGIGRQWVSINNIPEIDSQDRVFSIKEYHDHMQLPTLDEILHAFSCVPEFRITTPPDENISECTSSFVFDEYLIKRPSKVYRPHGTSWSYEGGGETKIEMPPPGWVLQYSKRTGFPSETSKNQNDAKIFGDRPLYFSGTNSGDLRYESMSIIISYCSAREKRLIIRLEASDTQSRKIGGRERRRSEQLEGVSR